MAERRTRSGFVAIVGRPNVGKSTLLNRLLGQKISIVSAKPQTTRFRILGIKTVPHAQMVFVDTPGVHPAGSRLNQELSRVAFAALKDSDLLLWMIEAGSDLDEDDHSLWEKIKEAGRPTFLLINKIDLLPRKRLLPLISRLASLGPFAEIVPISALRGENLERLEELILKYLPEGPALFPEGQITDQPERLLTAEFIREKIFQSTHQEIPYAVAVVVEEFREIQEKGLVTIDATIYVEKESQKGILIGKGGEALKRIGEAARREIEHLLGSRVYLRLWVKVKRDWRKDREALRQLGYGSA
ncbi:MAG: GTPase Era [candidate division NC10 bacterium]|nr:GTPase Era [candidate division NC10 bacterium]